MEVEEGNTDEAAVTAVGVAASAALGVADIAADTAADTAAEEAQRAVDQYTDIPTRPLFFQKYFFY